MREVRDATARILDSTSLMDVLGRVNRVMKAEKEKLAYSI
jgi:hypothetical protein